MRLQAIINLSYFYSNRIKMHINDMAKKQNYVNRILFSDFNNSS